MGIYFFMCSYNAQICKSPQTKSAFMKRYIINWRRNLDWIKVKCTEPAFPQIQELLWDATLLWKTACFLSSPAAGGRSSNEKRFTNRVAQSQSITEAFALCLRIYDHTAQQRERVYTPAASAASSHSKSQHQRALHCKQHLWAAGLVPSLQITVKKVLVR